ncbi:MAG: tail fiber domain-containing protein [Limisphaerales bacterium]
MIGGGFNNIIQTNAVYSTIGGGYINTIKINAPYSTIPGGFLNSASGTNSFAAGNRAQANHTGAFVWADYNNFYFPSLVTNSFSVRSVGGARFVTAIDGGGNPTAGVSVGAGGTSWSAISDRNAKKNFQSFDKKEVLEKLAAMPVEHWNYKWESNSEVPHIGPVAQDFKAAFYPGRDNKSITTLEFDGVELAAIQGLNEAVKEKDVKILSLEKRLHDLEQLVHSLAEKK